MLFAKVTSPTNGYEWDRESVKLLDQDQFYEVLNLCIGGSHTSFSIVDIPQSFNSVNFTFYKLVDGEYIMHDILSDPQYNSYL